MCTESGNLSLNKATQNIKRPFYRKCKDILKKTGLAYEFRTEAIKLLIYNYVIVLLIANQEIGWSYPFKALLSAPADVEEASRYGHELISPKILTKFGFMFRLTTVILNTLTLRVIITPKRSLGRFLLPSILWNFYTIVAIMENILEIIWTMLLLDVPFQLFSTIFIVGLFVVSLQSKLTLQVLRFYEYLNYK